MQHVDRQYIEQQQLHAQALPAHRALPWRHSLPDAGGVVVEVLIVLVHVGQALGERAQLLLQLASDWSKLAAVELAVQVFTQLREELLPLLVLM